MRRTILAGVSDVRRGNLDGAEKVGIRYGDGFEQRIKNDVWISASEPFSPGVRLTASWRDAGDHELWRWSGAPDEPVYGREREILELLSRGASAHDVTSRLHQSTATVRTHLHNLYETLGVSHRAAAVAEGLRRGLDEFVSMVWTTADSPCGSSSRTIVAGA